MKDNFKPQMLIPVNTFSTRWKNHHYKIDIEIWVFVAAGILTIGVAFLTVSFQSIKAALMNPVKSLKSE
ncbi:hypothetical protein LXL81_22515 [Dyadobacter sp. CY356]|nr:hypothetical protein [Dyadobacter sp. CY356]